ncbi:hypothetical protein AMQ68_08395 [Chryseobacterium sp. ERMR1:04]|nr:hypothetical protein AMQ68_08395 [Chryseobacterium sp. ERMR1:04]
MGIIGVLTGNGISNKKKSENKTNPAIEKLQKKNYSELTAEEKKIVLDAFLEGEGQFEAPAFHLNQRINEIISKSSKFPETLEIKGIDGEFHKDYSSYTIITKEKAQNVNYDKGTFDILREARSENSLGMKVRNNVLFKLKFTRFTALIEDVKSQ